MSQDLDNPLPTVPRPWLHIRITWRTVKNNGIVFKILQEEGGGKWIGGNGK